MKVNFSSAGVTLVGIFDEPRGPMRGFALFAHCFTCSKNFKAASRISHFLAEKGFGVLRFDFTGLGESEGEFAETSFSSNVRDLVAAGTYMAEQHGAPDLLIGHSFGGPAVAKAALQLPSVKGVVMINSPADPEHVTRWFKSSEREILEKGHASVNLAGRPFKISREFLQDLQRQNQREVLSNLNRALLVCHAPLDNVVQVQNAGEIFQAAKHPKSFISLHQADHFLSTEADAAYVADVIASWASIYLAF